MTAPIAQDLFSFSRRPQDEVQIRFQNGENKTDHKWKSRPNSICTTKYKWYNLIVINLWEQLHKQANVYFLIISVVMYAGEKQVFVGTIKAWSTAGLLAMMMTVSLVVQAYDDHLRGKSDKELNRRQALIYDSRKKGFVRKTWSDVKVGDIIKVSNEEELPADGLLLDAFKQGQPGQAVDKCFVSTMNLDGETNLKTKIRLALPRASTAGVDLSTSDMNCTLEPPTNKIYQISGTFTSSANSQALCLENFLLRGSTLRGVDSCIALVTYTGAETRIQMNSRQATIKIPNIEKVINKSMWVAIFVQAVMAVATFILMQFEKDFYRAQQYLYPDGYRRQTILPDSGYILTFFVLYSNLMPVSLYATMEVCNAAYAIFVVRDSKMQESGEEGPQARTTNLCHELGQVSYIFSDKTGTITKNIMTWRYYVGPANKEEKLSELSAGASTGDSDLFEALALNNTVMVDKTDTGIVYQAESPDEKAFVEGCRYGSWELVKREASTERGALEVVTFMHNSQEKQYRILAINAFDSDRKRMSVVVQPTSKGQPSGDKLLLVKGADTSMNTLKDQKWQAHSDRYADRGLRTMLVGRKVYSSGHTVFGGGSLENEINGWLERYHRAHLERNERQLQELANEIEREVPLIGMTAVEDELQAEIADTMRVLRKAGIKVWVLTGDNMRTAKSIGLSAELLEKTQFECLPTKAAKERHTQEHDQLIYDLEVIKRQGEAVEKQIEEARKAHQSESRINMMFRGQKGDASMDVAAAAGARPPSMIMEGAHLELVKHSSLFIEAAKRCRVVIICRASPAQKAEVVRMVRSKVTVSGSTSQPVTLAIGDGANDVPMIQEAQVGVGVYGQEGRQAVMTADFAIGQFKHLKRLLLLHGRWNYARAASVTILTFWRNAVQEMLMCAYTFYSGFSGTALFDDLIRITFTPICTIPLLAIGIFDRDIRETDALKESRASWYEAGRTGWLLGPKVLAAAMLHACIHSCIIWLVYFNTLQNARDNGDSDYWSTDMTVYTMLVLGVFYRTAHLMTAWNLYSMLLFVVGLICFFVFLSFYSTKALTMQGKFMYWVFFSELGNSMFYIRVSVSLVCQLAWDMGTCYAYHGGLIFKQDSDAVLQKEVSSRLRRRESKYEKNTQTDSQRKGLPAPLVRMWARFQALVYFVGDPDVEDKDEEPLASPGGRQVAPQESEAPPVDVPFSSAWRMKWLGREQLQKQRLKTIQFVYRPCKTILTFGIVTGVFLLLSLVLFQDRRGRLTYQYDASGPERFFVPRHGNWRPADHCMTPGVETCSFFVDLTGWRRPVQIHYSLLPYYQNYNQYLSNVTLQKRFQFNDTFQFSDEDGVDIPVDDSDIAPARDLDVMRKLGEDADDQRLTVWLRPGAFPLVHKRYGYIAPKSDKVNVTIINSFRLNVSKAVYLSENYVAYGGDCRGMLLMFALFSVVLFACVCGFEYGLRGEEPPARGAQEPLLPSGSKN